MTIKLFYGGTIMKKLFLIMALIVITLMGRGYNQEFEKYETEIAQLKAENVELQDTVYELDSEIQLLVQGENWWELPVYDDTVDDPEVDWTTWDNLRD